MACYTSIFHTLSQIGVCTVPKVYYTSFGPREKLSWEAEMTIKLRGVLIREKAVGNSKKEALSKVSAKIFNNRTDAQIKTVIDNNTKQFSKDKTRRLKNSTIQSNASTRQEETAIRKEIPFNIAMAKLSRKNIRIQRAEDYYCVVLDGLKYPVTSKEQFLEFMKDMFYIQPPQ